MSCWIKKKATYFLTYQGAKRLGGKMSRGELTMGEIDPIQ